METMKMVEMCLCLVFLGSGSLAFLRTCNMCYSRSSFRTFISLKLKEFNDVLLVLQESLGIQLISTLLVMIIDLFKGSVT